MQTVFEALSSITAIFNTTTRYGRVTSNYFIDKYASTLEHQSFFVSFYQILAEDACTKAIASCIWEFDGIDVVVKSKKTEDWSKKFLMKRWLVFVNIFND